MKRKDIPFEDGVLYPHQVNVKVDVELFEAIRTLRNHGVKVNQLLRDTFRDRVIEAARSLDESVNQHKLA